MPVVNAKSKNDLIRILRNHNEVVVKVTTESYYSFKKGRWHPSKKKLLKKYIDELCANKIGGADEITKVKFDVKPSFLYRLVRKLKRIFHF